MARWSSKPVAAALGLALVACSSPPRRVGDRVLGGPMPPLAPVVTAPSPPSSMPEEAPEPPPEAPATVAGEADLRHRLATAEDPLPAALELAARLRLREEPGGALAAIDAALQRVPGEARLLRLRATLLRDLRRREECVAALRDWDRRWPDRDPSVLLELAELEWLAGRRLPAAAALADLEARFRGHPFYRQNRGRIEALAREIERGEPDTIAVRDLLADLRAAPRPSARLRALHALQQAGPALQNQALAIALGDPSPPIRAEALGLCRVPAAELGELCRQALADPDWQVRSVAARRGAELAAAVAGPMLARAIAAEEHAAVFEALHRSLCQLTGETVELPPGGAERPSIRARLAEHWRRRWPE